MLLWFNDVHNFCSLTHCLRHVYRLSEVDSFLSNGDPRLSSTALGMKLSAKRALENLATDLNTGVEAYMAHAQTLQDLDMRKTTNVWNQTVACMPGKHFWAVPDSKYEEFAKMSTEQKFHWRHRFIVPAQFNNFNMDGYSISTISDAEKAVLAKLSANSDEEKKSD